MTPAEAGLLAAISDYLTPTWDERDTFGEGAYHQHSAEVQRIFGALFGCGWDPAKVAEFTRELGGPPPSRFTPACQSCGNTADLDAVHERAREGIAARTLYYCHQPARCWDNRHPVATSAGAA